LAPPPRSFISIASRDGGGGSFWESSRALRRGIEQKICCRLVEGLFQGGEARS
jgi:hypothetical protein